MPIPLTLPSDHVQTKPLTWLSANSARGNTSPAEPVSINGHSRLAVCKFSAATLGSKELDNDSLAIEEPLQLSIAWFSSTLQAYQQRELSLTMRTPGQDLALTLGFLFSQNIISAISDVDDIQYQAVADDDSMFAHNHIEIKLAKGVELDWSQLQRNFASYSSCGLCGKSSVKALALRHQANIDKASGWLDEKRVYQLPNLLRAQQVLYPETGAVHGAGLYSAGQWLSIEEDIGRHNAVDKVLGQLLLKNITACQTILVLTGRVSFELMQKAVQANIPVVVAVGAPSSLAIAVAKQFDISLIGFTKAEQFNVYHAPWRIRNTKRNS
ncbi:formate dehydrogenase accessory sulfurtransferase FdhD [Agarivorans sp. MS3-6]